MMDQLDKIVKSAGDFPYKCMNGCKTLYRKVYNFTKIHSLNYGSPEKTSGKKL